MITVPGLYLVRVVKNNPTCLQVGLYRVYLAHPYVKFSSCIRNSGTFEKLSVLQHLEGQGRVVCTPVSPSPERPRPYKNRL